MRFDICIETCEKLRYGYEKNRPIFCKNHKPDNAFDVFHPKCIISSCVKRCSYGDPFNMIPITCREHCLPWYCDVLTIRCQACNKRFHRLMPNLTRKRKRNVIENNILCPKCR